MTANRALSADVSAALRYWPGIIYSGRKNPPDAVNPSILLPFSKEMLQVQLAGRTGRSTGIASVIRVIAALDDNC